MKTYEMSPSLVNLVGSALERFASMHSDLRGESLRRLIPRKEEGKEIPYLYRNFLAGKETEDGEPGILLHKFVASDKIGEIHNHPWRWSVSFILLGAYRESRSMPKRGDFIEKGEIEFREIQTRDLLAGDINYIDANDFHRVELLDKEVWTLFVHGPRTQTWGFAKAIANETVPYRNVVSRTFRSREKVRDGSA